MTRLMHKVMNVRQGHDTLGPTGLTLHITAQERDAILNAFMTLERCRTILGNMAEENKPIIKLGYLFIYIFSRWAIHHGPLRADAKALLPIINEALNDHD